VFFFFRVDHASLILLFPFPGSSYRALPLWVAVCVSLWWWSPKATPKATFLVGKFVLFSDYFQLVSTFSPCLSPPLSFYLVPPLAFHVRSVFRPFQSRHVDYSPIGRRLGDHLWTAGSGPRQPFSESLSPPFLRFFDHFLRCEPDTHFERRVGERKQ